jgi:serine protease
MALRLRPDGTLDTGFGTGGNTAQSFGYVRSYAQGLAIDVDGKIVIAGTGSPPGGNDDTLLVRLIGVEITTNLVEFYNNALNHYFITADPSEATAIDGGAAGPGWSRTGQTWKSGGPNRVCRFYGSQETNPATGTRRGPNSHFYTIEAAECALVKQDSGWRFESYDFNGWPLAGAVCPAGTVAVKRAYNNRFAQNDSNHRYTISEAIYNQMIGLGWTAEGIVFCAPL